MLDLIETRLDNVYAELRQLRAALKQTSSTSNQLGPDEHVVMLHTYRESTMDRKTGALERGILGEGVLRVDLLAHHAGFTIVVDDMQLGHYRSFVVSERSTRCQIDEKYLTKGMRLPLLDDHEYRIDALYSMRTDGNQPDAHCRIDRKAFHGRVIIAEKPGSYRFQREYCYIFHSQEAQFRPLASLLSQQAMGSLEQLGVTYGYVDVLDEPALVVRFDSPHSFRDACVRLALDTESKLSAVDVLTLSRLAQLSYRDWFHWHSEFTEAMRTCDERLESLEGKDYYSLQRRLEVIEGAFMERYGSK